MKITRARAIEMNAVLGNMALGRLEDKTLEKAMTNLESLRKVSAGFEELKKELFNRLYGDVDKMTEERKQEISAFFEAINNVKDAEGEKACRTAFPALSELREKEVSIIVSLLNREVDVDIEPMEEKTFVKGILSGNPDAKANEVSAVFAPIFKEKEMCDTDFSELDELMK